MTVKLNKITTAVVAAAALSAATLSAGTAQAESRTFAYGTYGSAKYEGVAPAGLKRSVVSAKKSSSSALRSSNNGRGFNFATGSRKRSQIKISR